MSAQVSLRTSAFEARCQRALGGGLVGGQERLGDHEAQHPVAEKLSVEKFEGWLSGRASLAMEGWVRARTRRPGSGEPVAEPGLEGGEVARKLHSIPLKNRSPRHSQKKNSERPAAEKKMRSARPIRWSAGTKPTPAGWRTRLSVELSRLSPMKK